jgi:hypothetical protein
LPGKSIGRSSRTTRTTFKLSDKSSPKGDLLANASLEHEGGRALARFSTERIEHESAADARIWASPVPSGKRKPANVRTIFEFSAENAKIADWLMEQGGLEPPVSREELSTENGAAVGDFSRGNFVSILRRASSPSVRHEFRLQPWIPVSRDSVRRTQLFQGGGSRDRFTSSDGHEIAVADRHVELAEREHEQKTTTGQLVIIRSAGFGAVWSIPVGAGRCVSALRQ